MLNNRCTYDQRYDKALEIYLKLRHKDVYQLIHKHNLFASIEDKIVLLMDFDKEVKVYYLQRLYIKVIRNNLVAFSNCISYICIVRKLLICSSTMKTKYRWVS